MDLITICSVDVSGQREMRDFFNGIVRLQVSATVHHVMILLFVMTVTLLLHVMLLLIYVRIYDTFEKNIFSISFFRLCSHENSTKNRVPEEACLGLVPPAWIKLR